MTGPPSRAERWSSAWRAPALLQVDLVLWKHPDPAIPMKSQLTVEADGSCAPSGTALAPNAKLCGQCGEATGG